MEFSIYSKDISKVEISSGCHCAINDTFLWNAFKIYAIGLEKNGWSPISQLLPEDFDLYIDCFQDFYQIRNHHEELCRIKPDRKESYDRQLCHAYSELYKKLKDNGLLHFIELLELEEDDDDYYFVEDDDYEDAPLDKSK